MASADVSIKALFLSFILLPSLFNNKMTSSFAVRDFRSQTDNTLTNLIAYWSLATALQLTMSASSEI